MDTIRYPNLWFQFCPHGIVLYFHTRSCSFASMVSIRIFMPAVSYASEVTALCHSPPRFAQQPAYAMLVGVEHQAELDELEQSSCHHQDGAH